MEEKKETKTGNDQKLTDEQLNDLCGKLYQENQYLKQRLQQADRFIQTFNRLDYLFRVVELKSGFSSDFVIRCTDEIEEIMTVPEETKEEPKEN